MRTYYGIHSDSNGRDVNIIIEPDEHNSWITITIKTPKDEAETVIFCDPEKIITLFERALEKAWMAL